MWLLSRSPTPEEIISTVTTASLELTTVMQTMQTALQAGFRTHIAHANAHATTAIIDKHLRELKLILIGDAENDQDEGRAARAAAAAVSQQQFAAALISCLRYLPLETQKNAAHVFSNLVRRPDGTTFAAIVAQDANILLSLTTAYRDEKADFALLCGMMLRELAGHEVIAKALLNAPKFWNFFTDFVSLRNFEVASIAFELLKAVLVGHCAVASAFIKGHYEAFVSYYNLLLESENYVTCRESLRLLGEILLQRANFSIMMKYISDAKNLKLIMTLLRSKKGRIQIEAFHVFKVLFFQESLPYNVLPRSLLLIHGSLIVLFIFCSITDRSL
mmetsp:Transcript_7761/g.23056  ORF Transcript_7761/g.23056 Transcript_7761/m.23056 type:complete len:332 (+) Transcript_7761:92-1087(+)